MQDTTIVALGVPIRYYASMNSVLDAHVEDALNMYRVVLADTAFREAFAAAADGILHAIAGQHTVFVAGNGGSAGEAQHFAAEVTGRYKRERRGLPAIALTTDTSALTAIGNDYGFDQVFSRQLEALGRPGDVFVAMSTSGNSANLIRAVEQAKECGIRTVGLLGKQGGALASIVDVAVIVPSDDTPRIQEVHLLLVHALSDLIDARLA